MDLASTYKIFSNVKLSLRYYRYFRNSKSGEYIESIISNYDDFFHYTCLKYNSFMFSLEATKITCEMITDYHIQYIIENGKFPLDLEEDFSEHFKNNWYLRLSLKPFRKLIGEQYFSKYSEVLRNNQKIFNDCLEFNPDIDSYNEIGELIQKTVIDTIICSRIYYGSKMNDVVANAIRQRYPHILNHVYHKIFTDFNFIYENRNRLEKIYLDFNIYATVIQRRWRKYRMKHDSYFNNLKIVDDKIKNKRKRGIIEDDRSSSNKSHIKQLGSKKNDQSVDSITLVAIKQ